MGRAVRLLCWATTGLSLLLGLGAGAAWARSHWVGDGFVWKPSADPAYYRLYVGRGVVRAGGGRYHFDLAPYLDHYPDRAPTRQSGYHPHTVAGRLGFDVHRGTDGRGNPFWDATFPLWALALPAGLAAAGGARMLSRDRRRRRRAAAGQCLACGYDLRASPRRCPECGAVVKGKA